MDRNTYIATAKVALHLRARADILVEIATEEGFIASCVRISKYSPEHGNEDYYEVVVYAPGILDTTARKEAQKRLWNVWNLL